MYYYNTLNSLSNSIIICLVNVKFIWISHLDPTLPICSLYLTQLGLHENYVSDCALKKDHSLSGYGAECNMKLFISMYGI